MQCICLNKKGNTQVGCSYPVTKILVVSNMSALEKRVATSKTRAMGLIKTFKELKPKMAEVTKEKVGFRVPLSYHTRFCMILTVQATAGKWTVPLVVRQLQKKQITIKFLCSVSDLLSTEENLSLFVKEHGFENLCIIPDEVILKGTMNDALKIKIMEIFCDSIQHPVVYNYILENPASFFRIASWVATTNDELKSECLNVVVFIELGYVYTLLAAFPFVDTSNVDEKKKATKAQTALSLVVSSFTWYCYVKSEARRFNHLVNDLRSGTTESRVLAIIHLVNIMTGLPASLDERLALRNELKGLGYNEALSTVSTVHTLEYSRVTFVFLTRS